MIAPFLLPFRSIKTEKYSKTALFKTALLGSICHCLSELPCIFRYLPGVSPMILWKADANFPALLYPNSAATSNMEVSVWISRRAADCIFNTRI